MLKGKNILVGVTGSIAAYKAAFFVRLLVKSGAEVKVIMTSASKAFITPLTLATLSKNPVVSDFVRDDEGTWNNHVALGLWADALVIAPASANTLAKMANGTCDNLLLATYLSAKCPTFFAPAMDLDMYKHPAVVENIEKLINFGHHCIPAESGELASGLDGAGRLAEPENILTLLEDYFQNGQRLQNKKILITAGPTHEAIDPVRFIGNHSSGKMGYALAEAALGQGAEVVLVAGPNQQKLDHPNLTLIKVNSGDQMYKACQDHHSTSDYCFFAAAVADYKPKDAAKQKIKKQEDELALTLIKSVDIAFELGKIKNKKQVHIGFALETENELAHAQAKLEKKRFDIVVLNSLKDDGAGFGHDTNKVTLLKKTGIPKSLELQSKIDTAKAILNEVC